MSAKKTVAIKDHWRGELTKLRCWLSGYHAGRNDSSTIAMAGVPGEDVLRQLIIAIDDASKP